MRKSTKTVAAAVLIMGSLATGACSQTPHATQTPRPTIPSTQPTTPAVQPLNCSGGTGGLGCGPGWIWRDGWRGWGCYPC
jgi:hypothetical protein